MLIDRCRGGWVLSVMWFALPGLAAAADPVIDVPLVEDHVRQLIQDRDWPAAIVAVDQELAQEHVQADRLLYLKGRVRHHQGEHDSAVAILDELQNRFPDSPWAQRARFAAGAALVAKGDFDEAALIYRSAAESLLSDRRKQEFADIYLEYADAAFDPPGELDEPDYQRALSFYEKALDAGPAPDRRFDVALRIARCYQLLGATSQAGALYSALTKSHPDDVQAVEAQFRMGECYFAERNWKHARHAWQDLLAAHAESSSPWVAEASFHLARTWGVPNPETDEQMHLGVAACRDFLERFPTHERAGQAHADIAESLIARGRFGDAARQLQSMLADPQLETSDQVPRARRRLGHALIMQGRLSEALATWQEFLVKHPSDPAWSDVQRLVIDAQYSIAAEMVEHKLFDAARQLFHEFLAKYPLDARAPEIMFLFGQMSYDEEMWETAISEWRRLVAKFPDTSDTARARLRIAGVLEEKLGDFPAALEEYRKVVGSDYTHEALTAVARLTSPTLTAVTPRVYRSNETPRLALSTRNIRSVTVRAYQINTESYFRKMYVIGDVESLDIALIDPDASFVFDIPLYEEYRLFHSSVEIPLPVAADGGAIAVTVSSDTLEATTLVVQSDLDMIVKAARNEMFVFAQNILTQQPWPGVRLLLSDGRGVFAEAMTGPDGVYHASYDQLGDVPDVRVLAIAESHIASNVIGLEGISVAQGQVDKGYIYTDRPVYRPGQPVHLRGCLRHVIDGDLAVEAGKPHELEVLDPRDRVIWRQTVVPGEFGTVHTSFPLPGTSPPGSYQIHVRRGAGRDYRGVFRVAEYQWEPVRINLDVPRRVYYRGEQLEGTIRVQHYYGPPLAHQTITYQLGNDREYTAKTDERGEVRVSVSTRDFHADQVAILEVRLPDHNLGKQYSFYLANEGFSIDVSADRDVFIAGEPCEIVISTRDAEGHPVSERLNLRVLKLTTRAGKIDESPIEEQAVETGEGTGVARHTIQLEKGGHYRLRAAGEDRQGNPITGQIDVLVSDDADPERLRILADRHTYQAGDDGEVRLLWREKPALALITFEADYVLDYRLMRLETGVNVLPITVDPRWAPNFELHASVMVDVEPTRAEGEPDGPVTDVPSRPRFHTASTALTVERALQVSMSYSGSDGAKGPVVPGEPLEVTIRTTDPQGRPVPAEVSLVLFERASLAGPEQLLPPIDHFFRGDRRTVAPRTVSSVAFAYPPDTAATDVGPIAVHHRAEPEPPRAVAGWQEHPGHAQASVSVTQHDGGPVADPFAFGPPSAPTAAIGTKPLSSGLDSPPPNPLSIWGYTIRFETPTPAAPKPLAKMPGMPMPRAKTPPAKMPGMPMPGMPMPGMPMPGMPMPGMPMPGVSVSREPIARPHPLDVEVPPIPDPVFDGAWDIAECGPDGAPRAPGETVYWNPVIVTDDQGTATVLIEMPRRATVWTMVAKGITKDALAGEATER
jgi:alpha-2-macroglobulin